MVVVGELWVPKLISIPKERPFPHGWLVTEDPVGESLYGLHEGWLGHSTGAETYARWFTITNCDGRVAVSGPFPTGGEMIIPAGGSMLATM